MRKHGALGTGLEKHTQWTFTAALHSSPITPWSSCYVWAEGKTEKYEALPQGTCSCLGETGRQKESYSSMESAIVEARALGDIEERSYERPGSVKAKQVPNVVLVKCTMSRLSARSLVLIDQWISNCGPWNESLTPTMYQELSEPWGHRGNKTELI